MIARLLITGLVAAAAALPQPVRVYSEFQRIDPFGKVLAADRAERPREILSPALARGAWASFWVVVEPPAGQPHWIFIGQNPENFLKVVMYRPVFERRGESWVPDALEKVDMDEVGRVPPVLPQVSGQTAIVLWMDVWVPADAPVRRTRLEVQLKSGEDWVIYPMEMRIHEAVIPAPLGPSAPLASVDAPASETAAAAFRAYACKAAPARGSADAPTSVRAAIRRNARQDAALARSLEGTSKDALVEDLARWAGFAGIPAFCGGGPPPRPERGAEWYLPIRDRLYRTASLR
ncbi:MAG: hypothetical protein ACM3ZB_01190 [bacterium]|jgi:hypothetical protein